MLDLKLIRTQPDRIREALKDRNYKLDLNLLLDFDKEKRALLTEFEKLRAEQNAANKEIGQLQREKGDSSTKIEQMKLVSQKIGDISKKVEQVDSKLSEFVYKIPNIPHESTPKGLNASSNKIIREDGQKKEFNFKPKSHLEIGEKLHLFDFKRAGKISGSGFALFTGKGARLVRALINFMLDLHTQKHGFTEVWPPSLVNRKAMTGTGQLPNLEEDMYRLKDEDFFLIPTAEVPVTNIHQGEILPEDQLPVRWAAYTPCFRREAGSYGRDTKGLLRVHQFDKVELVKLVRPDTSYDELETLVSDAGDVLKALGLPFRTLALCRGDLSFAAAKCYDLEIFAPGTNAWLEVSSCSNFEDFQARRMEIKFRPKKGKGLQFVHTLNGSGVALARTIAGLLEHYQEKDGTVRLPEVLSPYLGGDLTLS